MILKLLATTIYLVLLGCVSAFYGREHNDHVFDLLGRVLLWLACAAGGITLLLFLFP